MVNILTLIHVIVCLFLVVIVLLQHGKGADMGATFGGSSQTVFGSEGPVPLLNKITTGAAILFMVTSVALAYFSANHGKGSIMSEVAPPAVEKQQESAPPAPVTVPLPDAKGNQGGKDIPATLPGHKTQ